MPNTQNIGLSITPRETNVSFLDWRLGQDGPDNSNMIKLDTAWGQMKNMVDGAVAMAGGPNVAETVADMTDTEKVYVYLGDETGYTAGNWYYYNGSAWVSGGVYQAAAVLTDSTLTQEGIAADAKAAGDAATKLRNDLEAQTGTTEQTGWTAVGDKLCISLAAAVTSVTFDGEGHIQTASSGSYTNCKCIQIQASEGDAFIVTAKGQGSSVRVYAFIKSDGTVIERGASNTTLVNETLYAPRGTAYFVVNDTLGTGRVWAGKPISMQAEDVKPVCYKENIEETVEGVTTVTHKYLHMFVPTANKKHYLYYLFTWVNSETSNALGWGLTEIHLYDLAFRNIKQLTTNGEVEMAINIDGRPDYIGIRNHGDEIQTDFKLYVDGYEIGENDTFSKRNFAKIQMYSKFTMYDPNDHTTIVGYHTRIDTINALDRTVTIENKVEFAAALTLKAGYLFMLPIMRTYLGAQVTDTFIDNQDYILTDCSGRDWDPNDASTHVFSPDDDHGGVGKAKHNSTEYKFWGEDYGLNGYARILRRIAPNGVTQSNRISNDDAYNKLYMSVCANGESVTNGDVWILETELYLDCGYDHL